MRILDSVVETGALKDHEQDLRWEDPLHCLYEPSAK